MNMTQSQKKKIAVECAISRRSCPGCDLQHLCKDTRAKMAKLRLQEHIAKLPGWKREYYGYEVAR